MAVEGILPVIPTPFSDGRFDERSFDRFLEHMLPFVDGYTLLGSTGEAPSLPTGTRKEIAAAALAMTPAEKTVVVGVSHTSGVESLELARHAEANGASAVLCSSPYYFANTADGVLRHLEQIDSGIGIDLVLYDNPVSTKTVLRADTVVRWASELGHLRSVKLTDHDLGKVEIWQAAGLRVLAGDDPILFRYLAAGVDGVMVIAPAVFPEPFRETWTRIRAGDVDGAMAVFAREILPFEHVFGIGDEIATTKALLEEIGVFASAEVLSPLEPASRERRQLLKSAYELGRAQSELRLASTATATGQP